MFYISFTETDLIKMACFDLLLAWGCHHMLLSQMDGGCIEPKKDNYLGYWSIFLEHEDFTDFPRKFRRESLTQMCHRDDRRHEGPNTNYDATAVTLGFNVFCD